MRVGNEEDRAAVASLEKLMEAGGATEAAMPEAPTPTPRIRRVRRVRPNQTRGAHRSNRE